jgi:hypothetical protein
MMWERAKERRNALALDGVPDRVIVVARVGNAAMMAAFAV